MGLEQTEQLLPIVCSGAELAAGEHAMHDSPERRINCMIAKQCEPAHEKGLDGGEAPQIGQIRVVGAVDAKNEKKAEREMGRRGKKRGREKRKKRHAATDLGFFAGRKEEMKAMAENGLIFVVEEMKRHGVCEGLDEEESELLGGEGSAIANGSLTPSGTVDQVAKKGGVEKRRNIETAPRLLQQLGITGGKCKRHDSVHSPSSQTHQSALEHSGYSGHPPECR